MANAARPRLLATALAIAVVAAACSGDSGASDDVIRLGADQPGLSLDDIQVEADPETSIDIDFATLDGGTSNLTDFAGTPIVVNFFAAWCPSCISEMPDFEAVFQERAGEVAFVGISQDQRADDSLDLIDDTGITYPTGWDPEGSLYSRFGGFTMPTTVFITADGGVAEVFSGALSAEALDDMIDELLI